MARSWLALIAMVLLTWLGGAIPCQARISYQAPLELSPLLPAEEEVVNQTAAGMMANLEKKFGADEAKRSIRAEFLAALLTGEFSGLKIHRHGVGIKRAIITGKLDLQSAKIPCEVKLISCTLPGDVNGRDSHWEKNLQILRSQFEGEAFFLGMKVEKNAYFNGSVFKKLVNFNWADIGNEFSLLEAHLESPGEAFFDQMKIKQNLLLDRAVFQGPARFRNLKVEGQLQSECAFFHRGAYFGGSVIGKVFLARQAQFLSEDRFASFPGIKVGTNADFIQACFKGPVDFDGAEVALEFRGDGARFEDLATFIGLKVGTIARFADVVFEGPVNFEWSHIGGQFNATGARFQCSMPALFGAMQVGSLAQFTSAIFQGPVSFAGSKIGGELKADVEDGKQGVMLGGVFHGEVDLRDAHLSDLSIKGAAAPGKSTDTGLTQTGTSTMPELNLERAIVDRDIVIENAKIAGLKARKLNSKGQTVLRDVNIEGAADLRDSRFLNLQMIRGSWPQEKEKVQLSGLSYDYICAADDPAKTDWEKVISWVNHSHFDRRNYVKLQTYFLQNNQEDLADKVFINMRRQEIWPKFWWQWLNPGFYLQLIFWDALAGYGREPFRIIWAALAMVLLGMRVNDPQFLKGVDWPKKNRLYDLLGRVLLSFEQFTPMVDLGLRKRWEPPESATSWHLLTFIYLQRLSGWILIPIFLTAIYTKFK